MMLGDFSSADEQDETYRFAANLLADTWTRHFAAARPPVPHPTTLGVLMQIEEVAAHLFPRVFRGVGSDILK